MKRLLIGFVILAAGLTACGQDPLAHAVEICGLEGENGVTLDEGGLFLDGKAEGGTGASVEEMVCALAALEVPDSVISRMSTTSALMGMVEATWGDYEATWTYHPDNGLDISIMEVQS